MNVRQAIEQLSKLDPEAELIHRSGNFELNSSLVPVDYFTPYDTGKSEKQPFRDAFDGTAYSATVWSTSGGDKNVVLIG